MSSDYARGGSPHPWNYCVHVNRELYNIRLIKPTELLPTTSHAPVRFSLVADLRRYASFSTHHCLHNSRHTSVLHSQVPLSNLLHSHFALRVSTCLPSNYSLPGYTPLPSLPRSRMENPHTTPFCICTSSPTASASRVFATTLST